MFRVETTARFERLLSDFARTHPDLRERIILLIERLRKNPTDPRNKTHALAGNLRGCYAASINWSYRIVFYLEGDALWLISIDSHDEVYGKS